MLFLFGLFFSRQARQGGRARALHSGSDSFPEKLFVLPQTTSARQDDNFDTIFCPLVNMDFWSSLYHALPRHVAVFNHTKPGINFKSIVQWYSLSYDNSYHYHVYSVLLLIYLCLCRCRHYYSCNKCLNSYQTSLIMIIDNQA